MGDRSRFAVLVALASSLAGACAAAPAPRETHRAEAPAATRARAVGDANRPAPAQADVSIHIEGVVEPSSPGDGADPAAAARFRVVVRTGLPAELRSLELDGRTSSLRGPIRVVAARDLQGPLSTTVAENGEGTTLRFASDPAPPLEITYEVPATGPRPSATPLLVVDDTQARVPFEWVALPRALDGRRLDVEVALGQVAGQAVQSGSTLAAGPSFRGATELGAVRRAYALLGVVGTARFDAYEGDDHAVWLGFTSFDPRWVAAESAAVRSSFDRWIGAQPGQAHGIVIVSEKRPDVPFAMVDRHASLWIAADLSAPWDPAARLRVAQHFGQRFFGGALAIGARSGPLQPLGELWSEGVARAAGREVLFNLGVIGLDDVAAELDAALAEVVLSPLGGADRERLVSLANGQGDEAMEARRVLAARGALWASGLDARRRTAASGPRSLGEVMKLIFARAATEGRSTWSLEDLAGAVAEVCGDPAERARVLAFASGAADAELPGGAAGSCHTKERRGLARFELGASWDVDAPSIEPDAPLGTVRRVADGSPAARAGLRVGDVLVSAAYAKGRPDVEAKLVVRRAGKDVPLTFLPRGRVVQGPSFVRRRGARDESCTR